MRSLLLINVMGRGGSAGYTAEASVLQGQKTSSHKIESTRWSELPSLVQAPANLAV